MVVKLNILKDIIYNGKEYVYTVTFSDNPYILEYKHKDIINCLEVRSKLNKRYIDFLKHKSNILKTSDLGFKYINKVRGL